MNVDELLLYNVFIISVTFRSLVSAVVHGLVTCYYKQVAKNLMIVLPLLRVVKNCFTLHLIQYLRQREHS